MGKNQPKTVLRRRDATGHLDPRYAAELLEKSGEVESSDPPASGFVADEDDDLAEQLGEGFVQAATSAEDGDGDAGDELIMEEPAVEDGDDDDLDFEADEPPLSAAKANRAAVASLRGRNASPERKAAPKAKRAKAKPAKAKVARGASASKAKATKAKPGRKAVPKAKVTRPRPKAKKTSPVRKGQKRKPARKTSARTR